MKKLCFLLITFLLLPSLYLHAQEVDILWHGDTYTPPFYQGRALWSKQSGIKFVAIPQGLGDPAVLNYKWSKNGTVVGNVSGIGRNSFPSLDTVLSKPQIIKVEIISLEGETLASASVTVTPIAPIVAVYENNPLYGFMFHRETSGTHELREREVTYSAFPLFFSTSSRIESNINYEWRTNVGGAEIRNSVTYRTPDNAVGTSNVRVRAASRDKIMQDASKSFSIQFGNPTGI